MKVNTITQENLPHLYAQLRRKNKPLDRLEIETDATLETSVFIHLIAALEGCRWLRSLTMTEQNLGPAHAQALSNVLRHNKTLTGLTLSKNHIQTDGAQAIAEALSEGGNLTYLNLSNNDISALGGSDLARALRANHTLERLIMSDNKLGEEGGIALAEGIATNTKLANLYLDGNQIGDACALAFANALMNNQTLSLLSLNSNAISDDGAEALADVLLRNQSVTSLHLANNNIGVRGTMSIAAMLMENRTLKHLNLDGNQLGLEGVRGLAEALRTNDTLEKLSLNGCNLNEEEMEVLTDALKENVGLVEINGVSEEKAALYAKRNQKFKKYLYPLDTYRESGELDREKILDCLCFLEADSPEKGYIVGAPPHKLLGGLRDLSIDMPLSALSRLIHRYNTFEGNEYLEAIADKAIRQAVNECVSNPRKHMKTLGDAQKFLELLPPGLKDDAVLKVTPHLAQLLAKQSPTKQSWGGYLSIYRERSPLVQGFIDLTANLDPEQVAVVYAALAPLLNEKRLDLVSSVKSQCTEEEYGTLLSGKLSRIPDFTGEAPDEGIGPRLGFSGESEDDLL